VEKREKREKMGEKMEKILCGIDEAGRGPLAGPVCAAAVALTPDFPAACLRDSKKLSPKAREYARDIIYERAAAWGIGWASHEEIDRLNIANATLLAMARAFDAFLEQAGGRAGRSFTVIADGLYAPPLPVPCRAVVKADSFVPEVMAASILAKTARDARMTEYAKAYPHYGYEKHKGYPTAEHRICIALYGPSPIQRKSFRVKPVEKPRLPLGG
jgi:ribonuclease HII